MTSIFEKKKFVRNKICLLQQKYRTYLNFVLSITNMVQLNYIYFKYLLGFNMFIIRSLINLKYTVLPWYNV